MILIADSGSTKTDWALKTDSFEPVKMIRTQGLNPFHLSAEEIRLILRRELLGAISNGPHRRESISEVRFYGTGCTTEQIPLMHDLLADALQCDNVVVGSDLLGAAYALYGNNEGIACILGTGANSGLYDGEKIVSNTPPLGYILGDEGSGAVLGKLFMNGIFKGWLSSEIRNLYLKETSQTYADVIRKVYREPLANRYLASVAKFVGAHIDEYDELRMLVKSNFMDFIHYNVDAYGRTDMPLGFVGSVAWYFRDELDEAVRECGYHLGRIVKSPLEA